LQDLEEAFKRFFKNCNLKNKGGFKSKNGFPRFKNKKNGVGGFRLTGSIYVFADAIQIPKIGKVRLKERGYIPTDAKILNITVTERAGRWFVSVLIEAELPEPSAKPVAVAGVDLGIKTLATCSDGVTFRHSKALQESLQKLRRLSRLVSRKKKGGANRRKAVAKLGKLHKRISDIRNDTLHKVTTHLAKTKSVVVIEDLNVSGMLKNRCLARAISDVGFGEFRRQMEYKGSWYGCKVIVADRFFPSSKMCCKCGEVKIDLSLSERIFVCECGNVIDRDLNAAINLERYCTAGSAGIYACGESGSGLGSQE
jgi:putative transposase